MIYTIKTTNKFKKDYKLAIKQNKDIELLDSIIKDLAHGKTLDLKHKDHILTGNWSGFRECHITPDWLLIYRIDEDILVLTLTRLGSHSELF